MSTEGKRYIGDSVYVEFDGNYSLILTTENGLPTDPSNTIVLEDTVWEELQEYVKSLSREQLLLEKQSEP